jgi:hypothetical protein
LILLTALIVSIWPTGPLDFGSRSPWDGLVVMIDGVERYTDEDGDRSDGVSRGDSVGDRPSRILLIASLPAVDDLGRECSLIVGTAFADHSDPLALLLQGETAAIRQQKIKMVALPAEMYRSIEGIVTVFAGPGDLDVDPFPGGLLHGQQVTPVAGSRQGPPPSSILLADSRGSISFEAHCDEQKQQRWRGDRRDFQELWGRAHDTDPDLLEPFIHGRLTLPEPPDPATDAVAPGQRRW